MFKIYRASAGSGKTFTLVKEFLRICLQSGDTEKYRHILAITFTNKACNEMKERIIRTLHGFSGNEKADEAMLKMLVSETNKSEEAIRYFSKEMLHKILQDYSGLSISTIDSFIHKVIRSFAYELDIPHNFEVHLEKEELLDAIVANVLDEITEDEQQSITQALIEFAESKIDEGQGWNIEFALRSFANELLSEDSFVYLQKVVLIPPEKISSAIKQLLATTAEFEQKINAFGTQILDLIALDNLREEDFYYGKTGIFSYFKKLKNFPEKDLERNSHVKKTLKEDIWTSSKDPSVIAKMDAIKDRLSLLISAAQEYEAEHAPKYYLAKLIAKNINQIRVAEAISRALHKVKEDENILPVNEFQTIISAIVSEQDAPIIYERIGEKYDSVLIDEFQDTSLLQFRNLLPLIENSQFKNELSLVVGDAKQSIYRWKGGEAQQLVELPRIFGSDESRILKDRETAINNCETSSETLDKNFRSREKIIQFNNDFYAEIAKKESYTELIYENHAQAFLSQNTGGYVRIEAIESGDVENENEGTIDLKAKRVLEIINEIKQFGYTAGDVAILVRNNMRGVELAEFLMKHKYDVETGQSLLFTQSKEVNLLLALIQYLSDRENKLYRCELLYQRGFNSDNGFGEAHELLNKKPFWEFDKAVACGFNSDELKQKNLFEICVAGIRLFGLDENSVFVSSFLDLVAEAQQWQNTLMDFMTWWNEVKSKKSIQQNASENAVKIMTIHKSKGLEFPVVIMPDADWQIRTSVKNIWVEDVPDIDISPLLLRVESSMEKTPYVHLYEEENLKSKSDTINLLYVATTRAVDRLYVLYEPHKLANEITYSDHYWQLFLKDKPTENGVFEFGDSKMTKQPKHIPSDGVKKRTELTLGRNNTANYVVKLKPTTVKEYNDEQLYGNKLHALISLVASSNNIELAKEKIALEDSSTAAQLQSDIDFVLQHAELAPYFSDDYIRLSEFELLDEKKEIHKPDFVAIHKQTKETVVLDFKSGKENNEAYVKQIQRYATLLKAGNKNVTNAFLVYTQGKKIEAVAVAE